MKNLKKINLLDLKVIKKLFEIFREQNKDICLTGGCVRDSFLGKSSKDIDIAAKILPHEIIKILKQNNIKFDNFAIRYGSIIAIIENIKIQITSLRKDINPVGRETDITFTNHWKCDAARRDFTVNAFYLTYNNKIKDFFRGMEDLNYSRIRFIGNIEDRIQEDYLRIFRYYRFLGIFKDPNLDKDYDQVLLNHLENSFDFLNNDLIRKEILKMFKSPFPLNSFVNNKNDMKKKYWLRLLKKHFVKTGYEIGLNKCLNKIDQLIESKN